MGHLPDLHRFFIGRSSSKILPGKASNRMKEGEGSSPTVSGAPHRMIDSPPASRLLPETLHLLDGGAQVYPAMLEAIEKTDPALAAEIRRMIFRFTDVDKLEAKDIAQLADKLETDDIVAALFGAPENISEALMAPLSQRNRRVVESELGRGGISEERSETARRKIAGIAVTLAKNGVITLPAG